MIIPRILFHLLPIVPFAMKMPALGIAAFLLVALPYIKVLKFEGLMREKGVTGEEREGFRRWRDRWLHLTLLKRPRAD